MTPQASQKFPTTAVELDAFINACKVKIYTGVGSRETPVEVGVVMCAISLKLTRAGWAPRSGAADGADLAFESGMQPAPSGISLKQIFVPYRGFNGSKSDLTHIPAQATEIAMAVHPAWDKCTDFAKSAHSRNACQVLGKKLDEPTSLVACWTQDGAVDAASARKAGGTRTAIVIAAQRGIPVFNLQRPAVMAMFREWLGEDLLLEARSLLVMEGPRKAAARAQAQREQSARPAEAPRAVKTAPVKERDLFDADSTTAASSAPPAGAVREPQSLPREGARRFNFRTSKPR